MINDETEGTLQGISMLRLQIGPVQDFIAAARTTRDLWSGSYLLSWLMAAAVKAVQISTGAELIFPQAGKLGICHFYSTGEMVAGAETPCLTNKLTAFVPTEQAEQVASAAKDAVLGEWSNITSRVWGMLPLPIRQDVLRRARYESQVNRHLSVEYAHLPMDMPSERMREIACGLEPAPQGEEPIALLAALDKLTNDPAARYAAMYHLLDHYLDAVRKVRGFDAWNEGRGRDAGWYAARDLAKDSLTGKEEQILRYEQDAKLLDSWNFIEDFKHHQTDVIGSITLIKRLWYKDIMRGYEDRLPQHNAAYGPNDKELNEKDNHYYAVLAMDGDRIGKALTKFPDFDVNKDYHCDFSTALATFAQGSAGEIVEKHGGSLIYAGGDDVLALLPLNEALDCANELQQTFRETMKKVQPDMTVSAGLAFAHSKVPLQDAVNAARNAESRAKSTLGRGAFSIRQMKRSGEIAEWGAKWDSDGTGNAGAVELLRTWNICLQEKAISAKGAHRLAELLTPYLSHPVDTVRYATVNEFMENEADIVKNEFESMLMRQWLGDFPELKEKLRACMHRYINHLYGEYVKLREEAAEKHPDEPLPARTLADVLVPMCSVIAFYGRNPNQQTLKEEL